MHALTRTPTGDVNMRLRLWISERHSAGVDLDLYGRTMCDKIIGYRDNCFVISISDLNSIM